MGLLALIGFIASLILLPSTRSEMALRSGRKPVQWREIIGDRIVAGMFVFRLVYTAAIGIIWGFLPVLADAEFHLSSSRIGALVMLGVFVSGVIQVPMGYLADRVNRKAMVVVGGLLSALGVFCYDWAAGPRDLYAASLIFGIGGGIAMPALMALAVNKGSATDSMGSVIALLTMGHSLGMLCGSLSAGLIMDWFDLRDAFSMGGVVMILGVAVFYGCVFRTPDPDRKTPIAAGP
jgi:MFS family permease